MDSNAISAHLKIRDARELADILADAHHKLQTLYAFDFITMQVSEEGYLKEFKNKIERIRIERGILFDEFKTLFNTYMHKKLFQTQCSNQIPTRQPLELHQHNEIV